MRFTDSPTNRESPTPPSPGVAPSRTKPTCSTLSGTIPEFLGHHLSIRAPFPLISNPHYIFYSAAQRGVKSVATLLRPRVRHLRSPLPPEACTRHSGHWLIASQIARRLISPSTGSHHDAACIARRPISPSTGSHHDAACSVVRLNSPDSRHDMPKNVTSAATSTTLYYLAGSSWRSQGRLQCTILGTATASLGDSRG